VLVERDVSRVDVVCTDLDGTFLGEQSQLIARNVAAVRQARRAGIVVAPATARSILSVRKIAESSFLGPYAVCSNGAVGYDLRRNAVMWKRTFPRGLVGDLVSQVRRAHPQYRFLYETADVLMAEPDFFPVAPKGFGDIAKVNSVPDSGELVKVIVRSGGVSCQELIAGLREFAPEVELVQGSVDWVEVLPHGVGKGLGVGLLSEVCGAQLEEVAVIGDHLNDLSMFEIAGHAFAVGNAHRQLRDAANEVVSTNESGGVADVLEAVVARFSVVLADVTLPLDVPMPPS